LTGIKREIIIIEGKNILNDQSLIKEMEAIFLLEINYDQAKKKIKKVEQKKIDHAMFPIMTKLIN